MPPQVTQHINERCLKNLLGDVTDKYNPSALNYVLLGDSESNHKRSDGLTKHHASLYLLLMHLLFKSGG